MTSKSKIIVDAVKYLQERYGVTNIKIKDYWEADENAIGVIDKTEKLLAYFSFYKSDIEKGFYLSLEELTPNEDFPYKSIGDFDILNVSELENKIREFFKL